jgi:hypothetical protein
MPRLRLAGAPYPALAIGSGFPFVALGQVAFTLLALGSVPHLFALLPRDRLRPCLT